MTGFGTASKLVDGCQYVVEVRAVNGRYLKCHVRLPDEFQGIESSLESIATKLLDRGTVTITVRVSGGSSLSGGTIDQAAVSRYLDQLEPLAIERGLTIQLSDVRVLPGVVATEDELSQRAKAHPILKDLLESACGELDVMRRREGETVQADLVSLLAEIADGLQVIRERAPVVIELYQERLRQRMQTMLDTIGGTVLDQDLVREVAVFAEKSDIAEEVSRLGGHLEHFGELIGSDANEPLGRTLDFLTQEMLRETNTIGSKCLDSEVSRRTVVIKGAIDRLKEQVQNIR
jgi:uncharacterized protein (TIGR00255 family)